MSGDAEVKVRRRARRRILSRVNLFRGRDRGVWGEKRLQEAVCVARRKRLVDADTLVAAGFRPEERRR